MPYSIKKWDRPYRPNPAKCRLELEAEGYRVLNCAESPGALIGPLEAFEDRSLLVISGTLEITVNRSATFLLEAGDRDLLPFGTHYRSRVVSEEPLIYLIGTKECIVNDAEDRGLAAFEMLKALAEMASEEGSSEAVDPDRNPEDSLSPAEEA